MAETKRTLVALVENDPGVLNRVVSVFRRRAFNIDSIAVGKCEYPNLSRITIVVSVSNDANAYVDLLQFRKQLEKLIDVHHARDITEYANIHRELALIRVAATLENRSEIMQIVDMFRANIVDVSKQSLVVEVSGDTDKIDAIISQLNRFQIKEMARTGTIALTRGETQEMLSSENNIREELQHFLERLVYAYNIFKSQSQQTQRYLTLQNQLAEISSRYPAVDEQISIVSIKMSEKIPGFGRKVSSVFHWLKVLEKWADLDTDTGKNTFEKRLILAANSAQDCLSGLKRYED